MRMRDEDMILIEINFVNSV